MFKKITQYTYLEKILLATLLILIGLFSFSLFKNIQYPLLWNDEADTAMFATRILKYGYPKVHDGKNILYQNPASKENLVINDTFDAEIESDWLQYYIAAVSLIPAQNITNIYTKTALLRIPFALIGSIGLIIMIFSLLPFFKKKTHKLILLDMFLLIELLSIPLTLHLREMRYYSLVIFSVSLILFFYLRYHVLHTINYRKYLLFIIAFSTLLLISSRTSFFAVFIFLLIHTVFKIFNEIYHNKINHQIIQPQVIKELLLPLIIILTIAVPYLYFFRTFYFANEMSKFFKFSLSLYYDHLHHILNFFITNEFLFLILFLKGFIHVWWKPKENFSDLKPFLNASFLLSLFFIIYIFFISRIPYYMFVRYFIVLQPIITIILLLDSFIAYKAIHYFYKHSDYKRLTIVITILIVTSVIFTLFHTRIRLIGHLYEITHQYKGPLDYIIPYVLDNYRDTSKLIIATNYEEFSYMFYLNSKVIIGYGMNNLQEDMKETPDIVIYRRGWGHDPNIFNFLLRKSHYSRVTFPIADYPLNNIPEFDFYFNHLFRTRIASSSDDRLTIFVRN